MQKEGGRRRNWVLAGVLAVGLFVAVALNAGRILVLDAPERSDVILVLAGETDRRPARALELLDQGYGRRVVIDVPADAKLYGSTEVQLAEHYIQHLPQAESVRVCSTKGMSTRDEAHDAEKCLIQGEGSRILIVTSDFHTRRALSIFRHELRGTSFSVAAVRDETQFGARWWSHRQWAKTCVDEWLRLLWWSAVDRWR
ncbi:MAG TPA: YdcF family protein [Candidatus Sulfotelmatobacter sp.]|nr:YdcF family protein [Candidatus Sulfotelmatobacter sp.]